ncbi:MAG: hypothetical protein ACOYXR_10705 [Nitrospirota bacterium]
MEGVGSHSRSGKSRLAQQSAGGDAPLAGALLSAGRWTFTMLLKKISYPRLKPLQKEIYNFQKVAGHLADYGFNCIKLADDWQGADFLAYHKDGSRTLKVQLKARLTIDKKYVRKGLYMAFPIRGAWYLIEHDALVGLVKRNTNWLESPSWQERGGYSSRSPNKKLISSLTKSKL